MDEAQIERWVKGFTKINQFIALSWKNNVLSELTVTENGGEKGIDEDTQEVAISKIKEKYDTIRLKLAKRLMGSLYFINKNGQPLRMMPKLELDPALLEQPLYH